MNFKIFFILIVFLISKPVSSIRIPTQSRRVLNQEKDIFILAGQSNMAGRGGVSDGKWNGIVPPENKPNPNVLRFNAQLQWEEARDPLHLDIDLGKVCGVGPGMTFANHLRTNGTGVVGLVPCAKGGSRISKWARGTQFYNDLVLRAKESIKEGGRIRGVLWYQGESDTVRVEDANAYKTNMENLIMNLRNDLNDPSLLFIQVALASGEGNYIETVRQAQMGINLPNVKLVDAKGLKLKSDNLHLTTVSQVHLGLNLAQTFLASSKLLLL